MPDVKELERWRRDLEAIAAEHDMQADDTVQSSLALISIEIDGLRINLPDTDLEVGAELFALHQAKIVELVLDTLQHILGYYALTSQFEGDNEPPLAPQLAHDLKKQLLANEVDVFAAKYQLAELLERDKP
jgi:hypothetical protein